MDKKAERVMNANFTEEKKAGLTYEEKREVAWELAQELLKVIPGEAELCEVDTILEEMKGFIYARAIVPKMEE